MFLIWSEGRSVSRCRPEGWLWCFAHPLGEVECWDHVQYPAFAPNPSLLLQAPQKQQLVFWSLCIFWVKNLPQLWVHTVIFSPIQFLCVLLLKERCVQVQVLQLCSKGSQVPGLSHYYCYYCFYHQDQKLAEARWNSGLLTKSRALGPLCFFAAHSSVHSEHLTMNFLIPLFLAPSASFLRVLGPRDRTGDFSNQRTGLVSP